MSAIDSLKELLWSGPQAPVAWAIISLVIMSIIGLLPVVKRQKDHKKVEQLQEVSDNSKGYQAGGDINVGTEKKK